MLNRDIERYVELRRTLGFKFRTPAMLLRGFAAFAEAHGDECVRSCRVIDWAACAPSQHQRRNRLLTVRRFALAMQAEDPAMRFPQRMPWDVGATSGGGRTFTRTKTLPD